MIHPHSFHLIQSLSSDRTIPKVFEISVLSLLEKIFDNQNINDLVGLTEEFHLIIDNNQVGRKFLNILNEQKKLIDKIAIVLNDMKLYELSRVISQYTIMLHDFMIDTLYGYTEHGTTKLKVLLELFVMANILIDHRFLRNNPSFLTIHTLAKLKKNSGLNYENELKQAYYIYIENNQIEVEFDSFEKQFLGNLGFLINPENKIPSMQQMVFDFLDKYSPLINNNTIGTPNLQVSLKSYMKMKYEESQIVSHASGYMYFATPAVWSDGINIPLLMDQYFHQVLKQLLERYEELGFKGRTLKNVVRNYLKKVEELVTEKNQLYSLKRVNKDF